MSPVQNAPYVIKETPGQKWWCACGRSQSQPYCDGSHRGSGKEPVLAEITAEKPIAWCGCKQTGTPPYCDGTHSRLPKAG